MMFKYVFLIFIPTIVYGRIAINVITGRTVTEAAVQVTGQNVDLISDKERKTFKIDDRNLKKASRKFSGATPTDVLVRSPSPWKDVYHRYNWEEVKRTLKPVRSRIIGVHMKPIVVSTREFENNSQVKAKYNAAISQVIQESVSNRWSTRGELTVGQDIAYNVNCEAGSVGGRSSLSFKSRWANETTSYKSMTIGTTTSVEVELYPGQAVVATLSASHGTLDIEVDYEAHLSGMVFAFYKNKYRDHLFWAYPVDLLLKQAGLPQYVNATEKVSIGFYTSARVVVNDKKTTNKMDVFPAGFIMATKDRV